MAGGILSELMRTVLPLDDSEYSMMYLASESQFSNLHFGKCSFKERNIIQYIARKALRTFHLAIYLLCSSANKALERWWEIKK